MVLLARSTCVVVWHYCVYVFDVLVLFAEVCMLLYDFLGVWCLMPWCCLTEVCVLLFEVIGVLCLMYWCCLPEFCVVV